MKTLTFLSPAVFVIWFVSLFFSRTRELNWSIFPVCCRLTRMTKLAQNVDWLAVCWSAWLSIFVIRGDVIIETFHRPEELFVCRNSAFFSFSLCWKVNSWETCVNRVLGWWFLTALESTSLPQIVSITRSLARPTLAGNQKCFSWIFRVQGFGVRFTCCRFHDSLKLKISNKAGS